MRGLLPHELRIHQTHALYHIRVTTPGGCDEPVQEAIDYTAPLPPAAQACLDALRTGKQTVAHLTELLGCTERWVRESVGLLEQRGYGVRHQRGILWLIHEPDPERRCRKCRAFLRRTNPGPYCSPCETVLQKERQNGFDLYSDDELDRRVLRILVENESEWVNLYEAFCVVGTKSEQGYMSRCVCRLRKRLAGSGYLIEARNPALGGGYRLVIDEETTADAVECELASVLGILCVEG